MFENLTVEKSVTYNTVTATVKNNPFTVKAVVAEEDGAFKGVSFIEVFKRGTIRPDAQAMCGQYGVVHSLEGEEGEQLTAVCDKMNTAIEEEYGFEFDQMPEPTPAPEPTPPEPEPEAEAEAEPEQSAEEGQE